MNDSNWTKGHFYTYVFLCIANADDNLSISEVTSIQDFLVRMHLEKANARLLFEDVHSQLRLQSEEERINYISNENARFFEGKEEISFMMDEIEDLILADNSIEKDEIKLYMKIRKALNVED